jgi:gamma-glutamylcyclotransferase (GGCT)/AIG2-like uncharacterized protein YtfP
VAHVGARHGNMAPDSTNAQLFVYGTLRKDCRNGMHHMLASDAKFIGHARMRGRLVRVHGEPGGYPGLVRATAERKWVRGEIYVLENPDHTLARLDEYEGCGPRDARPHEYERVQHEVILESGANVLAWVYLYTGSTDEKGEISSGDYCQPSPAPRSVARE